MPAGPPEDLYSQQERQQEQQQQERNQEQLQQEKKAGEEEAGKQEKQPAKDTNPGCIPTVSGMTWRFYKIPTFPGCTRVHDSRRYRLPGGDRSHAEVDPGHRSSK
jgi:hemolysin activation/secretion protein